MALNIARGIVDADVDFREGSELWGGEGNTKARLLSGADVGIVGFGDLGKALNRLLTGFRTTTRVYDPWMPASILIDHGVKPSSLEEVLTKSDFIFVVAAVTSENQHFLGADAFASMRPGAGLHPAQPRQCGRFRCADGGGRRAAISLRQATSIPRSRCRSTILFERSRGFLRSAHRAGALDSAFKKMGDMVLEDMDLMDRNLPPMRCKRAERETVSRMRSKPVTRQLMAVAREAAGDKNSKVSFKEHGQTMLGRRASEEFTAVGQGGESEWTSRSYAAINAAFLIAL